MENGKKAEKNGYRQPAAPALRDILHRAVFRRRILPVEDAVIDIWNRSVSLEENFKNSVVGKEEYAAQKKELEDAASYFNAVIVDSYLKSDDFERDDEGRIVSVSGEKVLPLNIESIREQMTAFLRVLRKSGEGEPADIPLEKVYEAGIYRYGRFSVEEAEVDVNNRLVQCYIRLENDVSGELKIRKDLEELKEAKKALDSEMLAMHFLVNGSVKDRYGRILKFEGRPVAPLDLDDLYREYDSFVRLSVSANNRQDRGPDAI